MRIARGALDVVPKMLRHTIVVPGIIASLIICYIIIFIVKTMAGEAQVAGPSAAVWDSHIAACRATPPAVYAEDRSRALRGRVTDAHGDPVTSASVRTISLQAIHEVASLPGLPDQGITLPVEAETTTDFDGRYSFPHLPAGARTLCFSAQGDRFAPATKDCVVIQDGLGAIINAELQTPRTLRVRFSVPAPTPRRLMLVPHRWWRALPRETVRPGCTTVEFSGLGGPFEKGVIVVAEFGSGSPWRPVARFDLSKSTQVEIRETNGELDMDIDDLSGVEGWSTGRTRIQRVFYSLLNPTALCWEDEPDDRPAGLFAGVHTDSSWANWDERGRGVVRGFAPNPFLPVLIESRAGAVWLGWSSEASEFEFDLPAGAYRARALDVLGKLTHARGLYANAGTVEDRKATLSAAIHAKGAAGIDAESQSREVDGFVLWENGSPAAKAAVYMQDAANFRRYLRRVEADQNGYFRFGEVPGDAVYFVFATPGDRRSEIKNFTYFRVRMQDVEVWKTITLHPHALSGRVESPGRDERLQLERVADLDPKHAAKEVIWTFSAERDGQFRVQNVPHGRFVVTRRTRSGALLGTSLPFTVGDGMSEVTIRWDAGMTSAGGRTR